MNNKLQEQKNVMYVKWPKMIYCFVGCWSFCNFWQVVYQWLQKPVRLWSELFSRRDSLILVNIWLGHGARVYDTDQQVENVHSPHLSSCENSRGFPSSSCLSCEHFQVVGKKYYGPEHWKGTVLCQGSMGRVAVKVGHKAECFLANLVETKRHLFVSQGNLDLCNR